MENIITKDTVLNKNNYYEAGIAQRFNFPALTEEIATDCCIVGGGLAGISAAIELKLKGYSVTLLEANRIGFGASGRNGGQIIVGYSKDDDMIKKFSLSEAKAFWDISLAGVELINKRIENYGLECDYEKGYLFVANGPKKANELIKMMQQREQYYGYNHQELITKTELKNYIGSDSYENGVYDKLSGHFNPLKYLLGLTSVAKSMGVKIFENSPVITYKDEGNLIFKTVNGQCKSKFGLIAGNVYSNGYGEILPKKIARNILPVGTYITVTEPLDERLAKKLIPKRSAICNTNFQLDYFRLTPDNRLLFGGDVAIGSTVPRNYLDRVRRRMAAVFPELKESKIEYIWGGHVDVTMNQYPDFGKLSKNLYYLQGFSGHGVALAGIAGKLIADSISGDAEKFDKFKQIKHMPFYGGQYLQMPMLLAGLWYNKLKELF
ncbi:NAD(P)/FAD-dependent oxidoreductase [Thorsellia kenyensis]|uniref:NAD(P)/FAD-dependent oxidoreductase n=1 Tax=Thorsellia kenyensis TaxID=1549888 RepID=A0ABV6CCX3_9GAMM